jgi:baculoviral IAP repeat-containing protein 6
MPTLVTKRPRRSLSPIEPSGGSSKRTRKAPVPEPHDVIVIEDSDDAENEADPDDLKEILAQIKEQEESEHLAKQLHNDYGVPLSSGSKDMPIDLENDAAMARQLAEEWALEDSALEMNHEEIADSSDIEILPGPSNTKVSSQPRQTGNAPRNTGNSNSTSSMFPDRKSYKLANTRPDTALEPFKQTFTLTRNCSKCSKYVKSPRGSVSMSYVHTFSYVLQC